MTQGLAGSLQHPRRSLGDRHRSQSVKFLRLAENDSERAAENLGWAEQMQGNHCYMILRIQITGEYWLRSK